MKRRWQSDLIFLTFLVVQVLDAGFTYFGVSIFGLEAEGNPIIHFVMSTYGIGMSLLVSKLIVSGLASIFHFRRLDWLVVILTVTYMIAAIGPWVRIALQSF